MSGLELLMFASTAASAGGQLMQGASERRMYRANARQAEQDAERARQTSAIEAGLETEDAERAIGTALTYAGASGLAIDGSAIDVLADLARQKRYNTSAIIYGGDLERRQLLSEAANYRAAGKAAMTNAIFSAAGTVLNGGYRMTQLDRGGGGVPKSKPTQRVRGPI